MDKEVRTRLSRILFLLVVIVITILIATDKDIIATSTMGLKNSSNESFSIIELSDGIKLDNAYPVKDEIGSKNTGYTFKIINNENISKEFSVIFNNSLNKNYDSIPYQHIRYQIIKDGAVFVDYSTLASDGFLFKDIISNDATYELKMWIDYDADNSIMGKYFSGEIAIK